MAPPPPPAPVAAPAAAEPNEPVTAESLGWQLRSALPPMRLHSVSLYNLDGDVLWLSEGALGPDEHNVVIEAIETQKSDKSQPYYEFGMEDGRMAVFLPIRGPRNDLTGTVMILADMKSLTEGTMERIVTPQVRTVLVKIAMFMRKNAPAQTDTVPEIAMPGMSAGPVSVGSTTAVEKLPAQSAAALAHAATPTTLGPREVEQILELELVTEPPRPPATDVGAPAGKGNAAATPLKKAGASNGTAKPGGRAGTAAAPAAASNLSAQVMPAREVEVLAFEPDVQISPGRSTSTSPADVEVVAFEVEPPVVSAAPAEPATAGVPHAVSAQHAGNMASSAGGVSVAGTPSASGTYATKHAATASTSAVRAMNATPPATASTTSVRAMAAAGTAIGTATSTSAPAAKSATSSKGAPADTARSTRPPISATQTAAVQIMADDDDDSVPHLISDTGPVPVLAQPTEDTAAAEPAALPPLEPLSVEESANDLTLYAQELVKLRSSGRTRRYEVLARSQRDAHRNEVPAAFVADSARGQDGAALDAMVVERLLAWLGRHGEAIWDSEPASFSVNLSIGAIEDETFPQRIEQWIAQYSLPAEYIGFEITEFACVQCKPAVKRFIQAIEKMGCFLVIDNFSFDSSVFEMLGSKALRHVKLDPKLTTAAMKDKLPQALVVAILQACKVLGVHCVAKRVESQSAMQWLRAVGCDFAQSFSLHKPLPLDSLATGQPIKALRE